MTRTLIVLTTLLFAACTLVPGAAKPPHPSAQPVTAAAKSPSVQPITTAPRELKDLFYGEALYEAFQGHWFDAIARLNSELEQFYRVDEPRRDTLYYHVGQAQFAVGDFELAYRMHQRASRAVKAVIDGKVAKPIRNEALFRLARIYFEENRPQNALHAVERIRGTVPAKIKNDLAFLRAQILMANGRFAKAASLLEDLRGKKGLKGFVGYNLGVALLKEGKKQEGFQDLDRTGQLLSDRPVTLAIKDKANLVLGYKLLKEGRYDRAKDVLDRVRLTGPFSNRALLGSGWADASRGRFAKALVPWSLLADREVTDPAVQQAILAVPYAYGKLKAYGRAAQLYGRALAAFGKELDKLDASIKSIRDGNFLKALTREEMQQDADWVVKLRNLPQEPETYYLLDLMASNAFQESLKNYLDLEELRKKLEVWDRDLNAFSELIEKRRAYYRPLLPEIDREFRRLDSRMRLRLEQRKLIDKRLHAMLSEPRPEYLETARERLFKQRLARLEQNLARHHDAATPQLEARIRRLQGVLNYTIYTDYDRRLTRAFQDLHQLDQAVARLQKRYAAFVRTRQAATQSYEGYAKVIRSQRLRIKAAQKKVAALMARQGHSLEVMAVNVLTRRRKRLEEYQVKARFALADSYDRAARAQGLKGGGTMRLHRLLLFALPVLLLACSPVSSRRTIAQLRNKRIAVKEERVSGGLAKAMAAYQRFLEDTPNSPLAPEAIRRLADLKVESEYGPLADSGKPQGMAAAAALAAPQHVGAQDKHPSPPPGEDHRKAFGHSPGQGESEADLEKRATGSGQEGGLAAAASGASTGPVDLERAGPLEAIALYQKLLKRYPRYQRNDQVLYQMSRAYEELGRSEEAMSVMDQLVRGFPHSRYYDEVQFRRAEYFFVHHKYLDAEDAYQAIVKIGADSSFYQLALYKLGWTYYKQELYDEALDRFIALLDYKVSTGYDFAQTKNKIEHQRLEDTYRVISLSFSYLGGPEAVAKYFSRHGKRSYEDGIYRNLGEYYFKKRRFSDAVATYHAFISANPFHKMSPHFLMRVVEIDMAGGFPSLVIAAKKEFATKYGLKSDYWRHFTPGDFPVVLGYLKTNLKDLANHYHALYQDPHHAADKQADFKEALHWYREFLTSFPRATESPAIDYQLADLLLENHSFAEAAREFEKTAYDYPRNAKSSKAGYAAVYAYRQYLASVPAKDRERVKRETVRSSLRFADTFPQHKKAAVVLGAAADDLYGMKDYAPALRAARKLLKGFPGADADVRRAAWLVVGHASYELQHYRDAETGYERVLALLPPGDKSRAGLVDNLAASIYKQGAQARAKGDFRAAADLFLRVGKMAPTSKIRPSAEYDAGAALIKLKNWQKAAAVLVGFRSAFPGNKLQPEVTRKIAYVYKEEGQLAKAAGEYERVERESKDEAIRREALTVAAQLYEKAGEPVRALEVYRRYVADFPQPLEPNLEMRNKIAALLKAQGDRERYRKELRRIVALDAAAGSARTDRTRYLAAKAGLVLAEQKYAAFVAVRLVRPLKDSLQRKRELMKASMGAFSKLLAYQVGEVTAAATFYLAEIYNQFSKALTKSERPEGLSPEELAQYNTAIDEQAYPFEEKAIQIHESNLKLIAQGIYNEWIAKSLKKLAVLVPARYDRPEESGGIITSLDTYVYAINRPLPPAQGQVRAAKAASPETTEKPGQVEAAPAAHAALTGKHAPAAQSAKPLEAKNSRPAAAEKQAPAAKPAQMKATPAPRPAPVARSAKPEAAAKPRPAAEAKRVSGAKATAAKASAPKPAAKSAKGKGAAPPRPTADAKQAPAAKAGEAKSAPAGKKTQAAEKKPDSRTAPDLQSDRGDTPKGAKL